ncbi:hypothetical protein [Xenorhabdus bovienii]|uniref:hypothetical protein n=1 Tax=Xenorhabdus bovienii TaxID=40576 RepID=UPI003DA38AA8
MSFYLFILDDNGKSAGKKRLSRSELLRWLTQQTSAIVAMWLCSLLGKGNTNTRAPGYYSPSSAWYDPLSEGEKS